MLKPFPLGEFVEEFCVLWSTFMGEREKLKEADSHVLPFLQMKPQNQGGGVVWCGRNIQADLEVCVVGPTDTFQQE